MDLPGSLINALARSNHHTGFFFFNNKGYLPESVIYKKFVLQLAMKKAMPTLPVANIKLTQT